MLGEKEKGNIVRSKSDNQKRIINDAKSTKKRYGKLVLNNKIIFN
jgi:hypothetical protein